MFFVNTAHERRGRRKHLVHKNKYGLLWGQLDSLANDVNELTDRQVGWYQIFLFVNSGNVALFDLLADDLYHEASVSSVEAHKNEEE